jgi:GMP synthase (glutamine-hydrolysing)
VILDIAVLQSERETGLGAFESLLDDAGAELHVAPAQRPLPDAARFDGVLALGGSLAADDAALAPARRWIRAAVLRGTPFLGVCLGAQLLASALGGAVTRGRPEAGLHDVFLTHAAVVDPLFAGLPRRLEVLGWHEDRFDLPRGAVPLAGSLATTHQAFRYGTAAYGLQFHPEVRPADLARWRGVPGYRELAHRAGVDFDVLAAELERAEPELEALARQLLERWLHVVDAVAELDLRLTG